MFILYFYSFILFFKFLLPPDKPSQAKQSVADKINVKLKFMVRNLTTLTEHHWLLFDKHQQKILKMLLYIRGVSKKKHNWCHRHFISIWNQTLHVFPCKIISLKSNTLFHSFLPCIYGSLKGFFWDCLQFHGYGPSDDFL